MTLKEWAEKYAEGGNCGGSVCGDNCRDCVLVLIEGAVEEAVQKCAKIAEEMTMRGEVEETRGYVRRSLIAEKILNSQIPKSTTQEGE